MHYRHREAIPGTQYRFIRELGAGGHGTVYAVEHTFLEAPAVMKLLHAELVDREDLSMRMTREAKTLAKLRHPNIVEVRDGGISGEAQPRPYFVMESLNGMPLRELLRHVRAPGGVGILPALRIMTGVLDGLEHAHRAGVIHRDIKPDNIFLHRTSTDHTVPKILDFGIAHLLMAQRTTGNYFLGTPRYAAPEQLRGDPPTARTDIYAAGLVLYEMLTGEAPFAEYKELGEILKAHIEKPLPSVMEKCPDAPLYLANFVSMLTAKDPNDRPPTAFAAAVGLRELRSRLESQQAGVLNNTGFKTEPTPMENMLHGVARTDDAALNATREAPLMVPTGVERSAMPAPIHGAAPAAAAATDAAPILETVVDGPRSHAIGAVSGGPPATPPMGSGAALNPTIPHTPRVPGLAPPIHNSIAIANTEIGAPKRNVDRSAETNTSVPVVPRTRPNHDTEMLLRGLSFDPAAYAETEQGQARSDERTPGALAVSQNAGLHTPQQGHPKSAGLSPLARQVIAFCLTLVVIAILGVPILWKVKKDYGAPPEATTSAAAEAAAQATEATQVAPAPPAASIAPPVASSKTIVDPPPAADPAPAADPPPVASLTTATATATASASAQPSAAPPVVQAPRTATPKPRPKPKFDPNDPSSVPMD